MAKLNNKGFSLVEVLAAVTIGSMIIAAATLVFSAVNFEFNSTTQKFVDGQDNKKALKLIEQTVSGSKAYFAPASGREWRFRYYDASQPAGARDRIKVFHYDQAQTLSLYDVGTAESNPDWDNADAPAAYSFPGTFPRTVVSARVSAAVPPRFSASGQLVTVEVHFLNTQARANQNNQLAPKVDTPFTLQVKLMDY